MQRILIIGTLPHAVLLAERFPCHALKNRVIGL
jgi:hypothetical protein